MRTFVGTLTSLKRSVLGRPSTATLDTWSDRELVINASGASPDDLVATVMRRSNLAATLAALSSTSTMRQQGPRAIAFDIRDTAGEGFASLLECDPVPGGTRARHRVQSSTAIDGSMTVAEHVEAIENGIRAAVLQRYPKASFYVRHHVRRDADELERTVPAISAVPETPVVLPAIVGRDDAARLGWAVPTAPASSNVDPAGWHADPAGRHESRFWNGRTWTEYVIDDGQVSVDWQRTRAS